MEAGLDLSSEAFLNLSHRFKDKTMEWLEEDKKAQKNRDKTPKAMDIYDTSKEQGAGQECLC